MLRKWLHSDARFQSSIQACKHSQFFSPSLQPPLSDLLSRQTISGHGKRSFCVDLNQAEMCEIIDGVEIASLLAKIIQLTSSPDSLQHCFDIIIFSSYSIILPRAERTDKMGKGKNKDRSEAASPSSRRQETDETRVQQRECRDFGLSLGNTTSMGYQIMPEGYQMCEEIFSLLMDRFEEALMKKRVDSEFKGYAVNNAIQQSYLAISISEINYDQGDEQTYNYDEESIEPVASAVDLWGRERKVRDYMNIIERIRQSHQSKVVTSPSKKGSVRRFRLSQHGSQKMYESQDQNFSSMVSNGKPPKVSRRESSAQLTISPMRMQRVNSQSSMSKVDIRDSPSFVPKETAFGATFQPKREEVVLQTYEVQESEEMKDYRAAMAEQHEKLSDFLRFKAQSRKLSQQYSNLAQSGQMNNTGFSSDHDSYKQRRAALSSQQNLRVTYSFDGKIMPIRDLHLDETKYLAPKILIQECADNTVDDAKTVNSKKSREAPIARHNQDRDIFDPKKKIVNQFEDNLEAIYDQQDAREAKDNDSNYSAESYERHKKKEEEDKKRLVTVTDEDGFSQAPPTKSHMSGKLSKVSAMRRSAAVPDESKREEEAADRRQKGQVKAKESFVKDLAHNYLNDPLQVAKITEGVEVKDQKGTNVFLPKPFRRTFSRQLTLKEYAKLKNSQEGLASQVSELHLQRSKDSVASTNQQPWDQSCILDAAPISTRIAPDSAQQLEREVYIQTSHSPATTHRNDERKRSTYVDFHQYTNSNTVNSNLSMDQGLISKFNAVKKGFRRMSLPKIQGVSQQSLSLLMDKPQLLALNLTPLSRAGGAGANPGVINSSKLSTSRISERIEGEIGTSMVQSPASHIIHSARREAMGLGEINTSMVLSPRQRAVSVSLRSDLYSPSGRRKQSNALLYGNAQQKTRIRLQLQEKLENSTFGDKVYVAPEAAKLLRNAIRKNQHEDAPQTQRGSKQQDTAKLRGIIKQREDRNQVHEMTRNLTNLSIEAGESSFIANEKTRGSKILSTVGQPRRLGQFRARNIASEVK